MTKTRTMQILLVCLLVPAFFACAGIRRTANTFHVHAESVRVFGFPIPDDDQAAAWEIVESSDFPAGAEIHSVTSTPADWTSLTGALGNLLWIHRTTISGVVKAAPEPP